jgi:hypothetical protein
MEMECYRSSAGIHCHETGCVGALLLSRTRTPSRFEDDYQELMPALDVAAVFLGWRIYQGVWWCPNHVSCKGLVCAECQLTCPACSCVGGPRGVAAERI